MFPLCLTALLLCQEPSGQPAERQDVAARPAVAEWTDTEARDMLRRHKAGLKASARVPLKERMEAVEAVAKGSNKLLVAPLSRVVTADPAITIRQAAADALGDQPAEHARAAVLRLLDDERVKDEPLLQATLVGALGESGYRKKRDWDTLEKLFDRRFGEEFTKLQKAIIGVARKHRELEALDLLCEHLDEPIPGNVDDAANPPAEYWENRWKAWRVWKDDIKTTLLEITGQRFSTGEEARVWLDKNRRKLER